MNTTNRDNSFELPIGPPRIDFARNSCVYQYDPKVMPKKNIIDHLIDAFKQSFKPQPKRNPIVKVRRNDIPIGGDVLTIKSWEWECHICKQTSWSLNWWTTQNSATRHARNHH